MELLIVAGDDASVDIEVTGLGFVAYGCDYESYDFADCDDVCLDGGVLYEFNITDQYGDGMCCNMVRGYFTISVDGVEEYYAGAFMKEQVTHSVLLLMLVFNCYLFLTTTLKSSHGL